MTSNKEQFRFTPVESPRNRKKIGSYSSENRKSSSDSDDSSKGEPDNPNLRDNPQRFMSKLREVNEKS